MGHAHVGGKVRGAPAIGIAGAYGLIVSVKKYINENMARCIEVCPANLLWKMYINGRIILNFLKYYQMPIYGLSQQ